MDRAPGATRGARFVFALAVALVAAPLAACSTTARTERTGSIVWQRCGAVECATLSVPLDWSHPGGRHIRLALARRPADGRRLGVLLANPGGPGASGVALVQQADDAFGASVREHLDIVSWDPRGVGASAAVDCGSHLDYFYAVDRNRADDRTARANAEVAKRFAADCERSSGGLLPYLSSKATVRDMDAIRGAMGERTIDYVGFSYGTYLGALYAEQYPGRVRAMALDGAVDPGVSYDDAVLSQATGFEHALAAFLSWCHRDRSCAFARDGNPVTAFRDLMATLSVESDPATVDGEHRALGIGEANIGVAAALYNGRRENGWDALGAALDDAAHGDGRALLALSDSYTGRQTGGTYDNLTAAFYGIACLDGPAPPTIATARRLATRAERVAPNFGASTVWLGLPCTYWPVPPDAAPGPIRARGAPPILVIGNTDDPATPYAQAEALAHELQSGRLLTYVGEGHGVYGRGSRCIDDAVDRYLLSLQLPDAGSRCR